MGYGKGYDILKKIEKIIHFDIFFCNFAFKLKTKQADAD